MIMMIMLNALWNENLVFLQKDSRFNHSTISGDNQTTETEQQRRERTALPPHRPPSCQRQTVQRRPRTTYASDAVRRSECIASASTTSHYTHHHGYSTRGPMATSPKPPRGNGKTRGHKCKASGCCKHVIMNPGCYNLVHHNKRESKEGAKYTQPREANHVLLRPHWHMESVLLIHIKQQQQQKQY